MQEGRAVQKRRMVQEGRQERRAVQEKRMVQEGRTAGSSETVFQELTEGALAYMLSGLVRLHFQNKLGIAVKIQFLF